MADEVDRANDIVAMMAEAAVADICRALPAAKPTGLLPVVRPCGDRRRTLVRCGMPG